MKDANAAKIAKVVMSTLSDGTKKQMGEKLPTQWKYPEDFKRFFNEKNYIRCDISEHETRAYPEYGPTKRKSTAVSHIEGLNIRSSSIS